MGFRSCCSSRRCAPRPRSKEPIDGGLPTSLAVVDEVDGIRTGAHYDPTTLLRSAFMNSEPDDRIRTLEALLADKPKLHFWSGQWKTGGLTDPILRRLFQVAQGVSVIETGAGLSTLVLLAAGPRRLVTVAPDPGLR